jgi:hypothetical protein
LRRWRWSNGLGAVVLPALFAGGELAWAYLWLAWFCGLEVAAFDRPALSWPASAGILALAIALARRLLRRETAEPRAALAMVGYGAVVVAAAAWLEHGRPTPSTSDLVHLPDQLAHAGAADTALLFGAYLWWRGAVIAREHLHFDDAEFRFVLGLGAITGALTLTGITGSALGRVPTALLVLQFFACALPALALARLEDIRRERLGDGGGPGLSREWLGVLGLTVVGILVLALVLVGTVSSDVARALSAVLNVAADGLVLVLLYTVFLPLGFVVALLVFVLRAAITLLRGGRAQPFAPPPSPEEWLQPTDRNGGRHLPPFLLTTSKWVLLALVAAIVAVVIGRAMFRYRRGRGEEVEEIHESLWQGSVLAVLWAWLLALVGRLRRRPLEPTVTVTRPAESTDPEARTVREIYRDWLAAAATLGRPRAPDETAHEFLAAGRALLPEATGDLVALTRAYEAARYGAPPLPAPMTAAARSAWRAIRARLSAPADGGERP